MYRSFKITIFVFIIFSIWINTASSQIQEDRVHLNMAQLVENAKSSVVSIKAYQDMNNKKNCRVGSGFIFDSNGLIVTRPSVIKGSDRIVVLFADGRSVIGQVLSADLNHHVALLKVTTSNLLSLSFGKTLELRGHDKLIMLGNSLGVFPSVTLGTYMGKHRGGMMGINIVVPPGNSGSPIINSKGQIIGLMAGRTSSKERAGEYTIGYFLPIEKVMQSVDYILREVGGWIGISAVNLDENSKKYGVKVVNVVDGGPADNGGFCVGDTIVAFDGKEVHTAYSLAKWVNRTMPGKKISFDILNSTGTSSLTLEVKEIP